jgi:uncharacterized protein (DUF111 family)
MRIDRIGYGAGRSDFAVPNVTRVLVGELTSAPALEPLPGLETDEVVVLEANIDDLSPQAFELAIERIFAAGALDVWTAPIGMKKQRPAVLLAALATPALAAACARAMLFETSSLGVRMRTQTRLMLAREIVRRDSPYGEIRLKVAQAGARRRATLEYDDVARIAREYGLPFNVVVNELAPIVESVEERDAHKLV